MSNIVEKFNIMTAAYPSIYTEAKFVQIENNIIVYLDIRRAVFYIYAFAASSISWQSLGSIMDAVIHHFNVAAGGDRDEFFRLRITIVRIASQFNVIAVNHYIITGPYTNTRLHSIIGRVILNDDIFSTPNIDTGCIGVLHS